MRRTAKIAVVVLLGLAALGATGCRASGAPEPSPNTPSSSGLVEEPKKYDGTQVTFTGEAIAEAMVRGDHAWLHLNDDAYYLKNVEEGAELGGYNTGMPVWIPADEAAKVEFFGDYKHEGDVVTVKGVFNAACPEHGGDMDIHAKTLSITHPGRTAKDPVKPLKLVWAIALSALAGGLWLAQHKMGDWGDTGSRDSRG
ncbi:MAG: hypothetical protein ACYCX5_06010 [Coriobacteriia bacterium]